MGQALWEPSLDKIWMEERENAIVVKISVANNL